VIEKRTIVRGRTDDPVDRLPTAKGHAAQPTKFNSGMWAVIMFVSSEAMFFAALFTTYFYLRGRIPEWEPIFGEKPTWQGLPLINTVELLASSVTMQLAIFAIRKGNRSTMIRWTVLTVVLGAAFLIGQGYEYTRLGFLPRDGIFAGVFFTLTGFHGAHVTGGVVFIALCLYRSLKGQFSASRHLALEAASIYWHFVDVVWIGLFTTIYIVG
jgi:cytochrome c oxidase subunit 3